MYLQVPHRCMHKIERRIEANCSRVEDSRLLEFDLETHVLLVLPGDEEAFLVRFLLVGIMCNALLLREVW